MREVSATFETYVKLNKRIAPEILASVQSIEDPSQLADTIAGQVPLKLVDKQLILEMRTPYERLMRLYELVRGEIEVLQAERKIRSRVKRQGDKIEREGFGSAEMAGLPPGKDGEQGRVQERDQRAGGARRQQAAAGRGRRRG